MEDGISIILCPEKSNDPFISSVRSTIVRIIKDDLGNDVVIKNSAFSPETSG
jgi:hypothetical protein